MQQVSYILARFRNLVCISLLLFRFIDCSKSFLIWLRSSAYVKITIPLCIAKYSDPSVLDVQGFRMLLMRLKEMLISLSGKPKGLWTTLKKSLMTQQTKLQSS